MQNTYTTLLLHFGTRAYLFSPDERSCYIFSTRNNSCEFLASYGVIFQSDIELCTEYIHYQIVCKRTWFFLSL